MKKSTRFICGLIAMILVLLLVAAAVASIAMAATAAERSETVYITANADGSVESVLSSIYLTNPEKQAQITDETMLMDIKNIGGSETPKKAPGNRYIFQTEGDDISYQGNTELPLPVTMKVTYYLNNKQVAPAELAGQSGHVKINVAYQNNHTQKTTVNGEELTLYTPFTVVTMITLDETFKNITVSNAKTMVEAGITTISATTFPGLAYDLATDAEDRLAESFTVEADAEAFELESITAIVMTGIVDSDDISDLDDLEDMIDGINEIGDAGDELYDGTEDLYRGTTKLYNGTKDYTDGVLTLRDGIGDVRSGVLELNTAAMQLADGAIQLNTGIGTLYNSLSGTGSSMSTPNITMDQSIIDSMTKNIAKALVDNSMGMINQTMAEGLAMAAVYEMRGDITNLMTSAATQTGNSIQSQMKAQMSQLQSGVSSLQSGSSQLQSGAVQLQQGVAKLHDGVGELYSGAVTLGEEGRKLADGVNDLKSGVNKLRKGVKELNEEGLQELVDNTQDISVSLERREAVVELGKTYQTFSGKRSEDIGSVKFVFQTESIYQEKPLAEEPVENAPAGEGDAQTQAESGAAAEPGFFTRIWNWLVDFFTAD